MKIGVVKEIRDRENRVALTPQGAEELVKRGHSAMVEAGAGIGSGFDHEAYRQAGAMLVTAAEVWNADLVVKVKEPLESEYRHLRDQIVFTYSHLSGVPRALTEALLDRRTTAIAYETVEDAEGRLPLLARQHPSRPHLLPSGRGGSEPLGEIRGFRDARRMKRMTAGRIRYGQAYDAP